MDLSILAVVFSVLAIFISFGLLLNFIVNRCSN